MLERRSPAARTVVRLATRQPFDGAGVLRFLAVRAVAGVEEVLCDGPGGGTYRRALRLSHGDVLLEATPQRAGVRLALRLDDGRDLPAAVACARRLFDLDADPDAIASVLGRLAAPRPGLRVPGAVDPWEPAVRAVLGQQISVAAARRVAGRLTERLGEPLVDPVGGVTRHFPGPAAIAEAPDDAFPMPRARAATLRRLAALAVEGDLDAEALAGLPGVGPWTTGYVALRLGDPDVFLATDAAIVRALGGRRDGAALAEQWRPWRSYAVMHLWASLA